MNSNIVFGLIFGEGRTGVELRVCVYACARTRVCVCVCVCQETTDQAVSINFNFIHPKISIRREQSLAVRTFHEQS